MDLSKLQKIFNKYYVLYKLFSAKIINIGIVLLKG